MKTMARAGLGIAILPEQAVRSEVRRGTLHVLNVSRWQLVRVSGLLRPSGRLLSGAGRALVEALVESKGQ